MNPRTQQLAFQRYRGMATITIAAVYFLILVGGSVRASGAGMGCPDWPTCFGRWIPPTSEAQLPADYQTIYASLGYRDNRFNPVKTWTEYANRLIGVCIGILIFFTALRSWPLRRYDRAIFTASGTAFLMVGLQGWLGARVVSSNLQPGMITLHMLMALAIVGALLFGLSRSRQVDVANTTASIHPRFHKWLSVLLALTLLQVVMGTQVREMTDYIRADQGEALRSGWIAAMPWFFYVHRSFSALVLLIALWLAWLVIVSPERWRPPGRLTLLMTAVTITAVLSGATLGHLGMPAFVQPLHLLAAALLFGMQFTLWLGYRQRRPGAAGEKQTSGEQAGAGINFLT